MPTLRDAERYVGWPYVEGEFDCMHLAVMVQADLFGRVVPWPAEHPAGDAAQMRAIRRHAPELADRVAEPRAGDAVLMVCTTDKGTHLHIGTLFEQLGERWVLHSGPGTDTILQRLVDARRLGARVEGFYRWRA